MCLGFDVHDECVKQVKYETIRKPLSGPLASDVLYTKYSGWSYEEEWRGYIPLGERDGPHFFSFLMSKYN